MVEETRNDWAEFKHRTWPSFLFAPLLSGIPYSVQKIIHFQIKFFKKFCLELLLLPVGGLFLRELILSHRKRNSQGKIFKNADKRGLGVVSIEHLSYTDLGVLQVSCVISAVLLCSVSLYY